MKLKKILLLLIFPCLTYGQQKKISKLDGTQIATSEIDQMYPTG
ncbi:MAG: hypothetical protein ABI237_17070 [Ginsengibacter sp.]